MNDARMQNGYTSNLDVIWCLHKVRTRDGAIGDETRPISGL